MRCSKANAPHAALFESVYVRSREDAMTYAIHASKNGQSVVTLRISPEAAVDKAGLLESLGWHVHITDTGGRQFSVSFDTILWRNRETV
jgi:hypothetical protein